MINKITWSEINSFGKMRFSRTSYFILVLIPILVKATEKIKSPIEIIIGETNHLISIELPFNWYVFYFGAIAIAIGSLIYQIVCPSLIKKYKDYGEFLTAGESDSYIKKTAEKFSIRSLEVNQLYNEFPFDVDQVVKEDGPQMPYSMRRAPDAKKYVTTNVYSPNIRYSETRKNAFNTLYNKIELYKIGWIYTSFAFYMLGFGAFIYVIIQNIVFVIKTLLV